MKPWPRNTIAVICRRLTDPHRIHRSGSRPDWCWQCNRVVMIVEETRQRLRTVPRPLGWRIVCAECARVYVDRSGRKMRELP